ncbi:MAG: phosphatidate cytidylyltransferase [Clostridium sp.]|nr:MAG: phosphatidate cytidylyltransferase [Clostridium sp.]
MVNINYVQVYHLIKTIEGAVGGAIFGTFFGSVFYLTMFNGNTFIIILISLLLSIVAQCGDLVFSAIKREYDVKDFGKKLCQDMVEC